jgi:hypothetical protein
MVTSVTSAQLSSAQLKDNTKAQFDSAKALNSQKIARMPWDGDPMDAVKKMSPAQKKQNADNAYKSSIQLLQKSDDESYGKNALYELYADLDKPFEDMDNRDMRDFQDNFGKEQLIKYFEINAGYCKDKQFTKMQTVKYQTAFFDSLPRNYEQKSSSQKPSLQDPKVQARIKEAQKSALRAVQDYKYTSHVFQADKNPTRSILLDQAELKLKSFVDDHQDIIKSVEKNRGGNFYVGGWNTDNTQFYKNHLECKKRGYDPIQELVYQYTYLKIADETSKNAPLTEAQANATIKAQAAYGSLSEEARDIVTKR